MVYKSHIFIILQYFCLYWWFINSTSWVFCNISACNFGLKIPPLENFAIFLGLCNSLWDGWKRRELSQLVQNQDFKPSFGETAGDNSKNLIFSILNSCQELNPTEISLSIIGRKLKCCQENKWVYCCCPISATMPMKLIQSPYGPIK